MDAYNLMTDLIALSVAACCNWWAQRSVRLALLEFDRVRKSMGTIVRTQNGANKLLVKVLHAFSLDNSVIQMIFLSHRYGQ